MDNLEKFATELNDLISENKRLKYLVKEKDELLKRAIAINGELEIASILDESIFNYFISNSVISFSLSNNRMHLLWNLKNSDGGFDKITQSELNAIFKLNKEIG